MPNIKQEKSLQEKLKAFFRVGRTAGFPHPSSYELVLSAEQCEELGAGQPTPGRLRLLRDLGIGPQVREQRLQQHGPELLWYRIQVIKRCMVVKAGSAITNAGPAGPGPGP